MFCRPAKTKKTTKIGLNFLLLFLFFCFVYFLQTSQSQKNKSSDPWRGTQERLDRRHRSELFVFVFFMFFCFWTLVGLNLCFFSWCVCLLFSEAILHLLLFTYHYPYQNLRFYNLHHSTPHGYPFCQATVCRKPKAAPKKKQEGAFQEGDGNPQYRKTGPSSMAGSLGIFHLREWMELSHEKRFYLTSTALTHRVLLPVGG